MPNGRQPDDLVKRIRDAARQRGFDLSGYSDDEILSRVRQDMTPSPDRATPADVERMRQFERTPSLPPPGLGEEASRSRRADEIAAKLQAQGRLTPLNIATMVYPAEVEASLLKVAKGVTSPSNLLLMLPYIRQVAAPYMAYEGLKSAMTPRQAGETNADRLERLFFGLAGVAGSRAALETPPVTTILRPAVSRALGRSEVAPSTMKSLGRFVTGTSEEFLERLRRERQGKVERWAERAKEMRTKQAEQARITSQRQTLEASTSVLTRKVMQNVEELHQRVRSNLDNRWNALRNKVGVDTSLNMDRVSAAIDRAKSTILRGEPESVRLFDSLLEESPAPPSELEQATVFRGRRTGFTGKVTSDVGGLARRMGASGMSGADVRSSLANLGYSARDIDAAVRGEDVSAPAAGRMTFDGGRIRYTALGEKLMSGSLPGNVYRAVRLVRDTLGQELHRTAESKGAGAEYDSLLEDWSQYMSDWNDMRSLTVGGSPLARAYRAVDAPVVRALLAGKAGGRLVGQLARYRDQGAMPMWAEQVRRLNSALTKLPTARVVGKLPEFPERIIPEKARAQELERAAAELRRLHRYDVLPFLWPYTLVRKLAASALEKAPGRWIAGGP